MNNEQASLINNKCKEIFNALADILEILPETDPNFHIIQNESRKIMKVVIYEFLNPIYSEFPELKPEEWDG